MDTKVDLSVDLSDAAIKAQAAVTWRQMSPSQRRMAGLGLFPFEHMRRGEEALEQAGVARRDLVRRFAVAIMECARKAGPAIVLLAMLQQGCACSAPPAAAYHTLTSEPAALVESVAIGLDGGVARWRCTYRAPGDRQATIIEESAAYCAPYQVTP